MTRPSPVLQSPGSHDCTFAAGAYACRLFGHEVALEAVKAWTAKGAAWYPAEVLGVPWTPCRYEGPERALWWLGPDAGPWVRRWLDGGYVGAAVVHAGHPTDMHAVVLLDGDDEGVTLMDPMTGFVRWTWGRFLAEGAGAGKHPHRVHHIVGWYGPVPSAAARAA